jgi:hypothetical protein
MLNGFCCALESLAKKIQQNKIEYTMRMFILRVIFLLIFMFQKYNKKSLSMGILRDSFISKNLLIAYFFKAAAIVFPMSAGLAQTWIPHAAMIFILASAVSSAPPMIAPA